QSARESCAPSDRQPGADPEPARRTRPRLKLASQGGHALPHPRNTTAAVAVGVRTGTAPVIVDLYREGIRLEVEVHRRGVRARVAHHIGKRLLDDPERGQ